MSFKLERFQFTTFQYSEKILFEKLWQREDNSKNSYDNFFQFLTDTHTKFFWQIFLGISLMFSNDNVYGLVDNHKLKRKVDQKIV